MFKFIFLLFTAVFVLDAILNGQPARAADTVETAIQQEISKGYPGATIELTAPIRWVRGTEPVELTKVAILSEGGRGEVRFAAADRDNSWSEGVTGFTAQVPAWIATRRIHPGEKLAREMFTVQKMNIAWGPARDYRGVILSPANVKDMDLLALETRQTVLEGQFLTATAVQKTPDVRRGDSVTILIQTGGLTLSTVGTAQEAANLNGQVRVMTNKTKRELTGNLRTGGLVEVRL